ncbi:MAG TPA: CHAT domain-containing protein, partial [Dongiaceae bacterium]
FLVGHLPAGASADVSFNVYARQAGTDVPVHLDLTYRGPAGRRHDEARQTIRVGRNQPIRPSMTRVLFLGASPPDLPPIRIDEEIREIQQEIGLGKQRDRLQLETRWAVRPRDISRALLEVEPHFVHFAGHGGGGEESFAAEDDLGNASVVPVDGLVELFEIARENVECVLVNACSTERLARGLSSVVRWVIGMRQPVGDRSAIWFSIGFYQALAAGRPIGDAFRLGRAQMKMRPGSDGDPLAPLLLSRDD